MQSILNRFNIALTATKQNIATSPHIYDLSSISAFIGALKPLLLQLFKKISRLFLLPLLALALVSCGGGSSGSTSPPVVNPPNPNPTKDAVKIEFKHTGMHQVVISAQTDTDSTLGFVVSLSSTPPTYNDIKDKDSFYTRKFASGTARLIYLSATDKTPDNLDNFESTKTTSNGNKILTNDAQFMKEATDYTIHVYNSEGNALYKKSFTTQRFPTEAEIADTSSHNAYGLEALEEFTVDIKANEVFVWPAIILRQDLGIALGHKPPGSSGSTDSIMECLIRSIGCGSVAYSKRLAVNFDGELKSGSGFITKDILLYLKLSDISSPATANIVIAVGDDRKTYNLLTFNKVTE